MRREAEVLALLVEVMVLLERCATVPETRCDAKPQVSMGM
jgi:hypothetical protein